VKEWPVCELKGNKREQAGPGRRINDASNSNYYQQCLVIVLRHKSLILPDSEYAMKTRVHIPYRDDATHDVEYTLQRRMLPYTQ